MPKIFLPVNETAESVLRPVVLDITRRLLKDTGIPSDTRILYPGDFQAALIPGTSINPETAATNPDNKDTIRLASASQVTIDVQETYPEAELLNSAVHVNENLFIFKDLKLETSIRPVYTSSEVVINVRFRARDKASAERWRDEIRARIAMRREGAMHEVKYHYLIPAEMLIILQEIHRMRETVAPYGEDWETYFANNSSKRVHELTNQSGSVKRLAVAETQQRIQGMFDFTGMPEKGEKDADAATWTISFAYKFFYQKPIGCSMFYPLMVHNQFLDQKYRPTDEEQPPYSADTKIQQATLSGLSMSIFEANTQAYRRSHLRGYAIPSCDEFLPVTVLPATMRIYTALTMLDLEPGGNPRFMLNLADNGYLEFDPEVLAFMKKEAQYMGKEYRSVFALSLYEGINIAGSEKLMVDPDLNVFSTIDLDPRKYYHVRLALVTDWEYLTRDAWERLRNAGPVLIKLIAAIGPWAIDRGLTNCILPNGVVPKQCMTTITEGINRNEGKEAYNFNTVQYLSIEASAHNADSHT